MTLPPRCQHQIDTARHAPHTIVICPRTALPGGKWCALHDIPELGTRVHVTRAPEAGVQTAPLHFVGTLTRIGIVGFTIDTDPPNARQLTLSFVPPWGYTQTIKATGDSNLQKGN